jgi:ubiquinone/menaquinone biosynthesis C-methylase UbiE
MPDEIGNFQTAGLSWQERAEKYNDISAVYSSDLNKSRWLSNIYSACLSTIIRRTKKGYTALDFGCGIGHLTRQLSSFAERTFGVDITSEMLRRAQDANRNSSILFGQIDGIYLPFENNSIDLIWVSGVLRYSLLVPQPKHREIVKEFFRVLKPGGWVYNLEMYVDQSSSVFSRDFLENGFFMKYVSVVHVRNSVFDNIALGYHRILLRRWWASLSIWWTQNFASEENLGLRIRDYLFNYQKPLR